MAPARIGLVACVLCALFAAPLAAQEAPQVHHLQPEHYLLTTTVGVPLRFTRDVDFDQGVVAPVYTDALLGYAFASDVRLRHGFGLGASLNISEEGGFTTPVGVGEQFVLMPAYLLYYDMDADWSGLAHLGVPFNLSGGTTVGAEVAGGMAYKLRAGLGLFGELGLTVFPGAESTLHPTLSLELGVLFDYEVLP